ncbi:DUF4910 domain-containing protein [bacterium]|nr:DUF4910 domain-containing protein [bacterium]
MEFSQTLSVEIDRYLKKLFPICRSLTGSGNRETLRILNEITPIDVKEIPSGTKTYDWVVPPEWDIRGAFIGLPDGTRIADFKENNLHVMSYSIPVQKTLSWEELEPHLHRHPHLPNAIPYRTTYYREEWGFCVTHDQYAALKTSQGPFSVSIDSSLKPGSLTYGECLIPGKSKQEILISCYICHPSMANDSLSGVILTAFLAQHLRNFKNSYWSYRIVFVPETLGAIAYSFLNEAKMKHIDIGLVVTTVGGQGDVGYKQAWNKEHPINRLVESVFKEAGKTFKTYPFDIHGSDERQYSTQGFKINCVTLCKDRYYEYPQYHSSLDNLSFVTGSQIFETFELYCNLIKKLEARRIYKNTIPCGEVMLSKHDLYPSKGGAQRPELGGRSELDLILWLLFLCDGRKSVDDIAVELGVGSEALLPIIERLRGKGVLTLV